jgi:hypothetical protein
MNQNSKLNSSSSIRDAFKATKIGITKQTKENQKLQSQTTTSQSINQQRTDDDMIVSNLKSQSSKGLFKEKSISFREGVKSKFENQTPRPSNQEKSNMSSSAFSSFEVLQNEVNSTMINSFTMNMNLSGIPSMQTIPTIQTMQSIPNMETKEIKERRDISSKSNLNLFNNIRNISNNQFPSLTTMRHQTQVNSYVPQQGQQGKIVYQQAYNQQATQKLEEVIINDNDFKITDFYLYEDRLFEIVYNFNIPTSIISNLHDWWLVFNNSSISGKYLLTTNDKIISSIINDYMNLELLSILILYHIEILCLTKTFYGKIRKIFYYLQYSFNLLFDFIISSCKFQVNNQKWVSKIKTKINKNLKAIKANESVILMNNSSESIDTIAIIGVNNDRLIMILNEILSSDLLSKNYNQAIAFYQSTLSSLHSSSLIILNDFFINKVLTEYNYLSFHNTSNSLLSTTNKSQPYISIPRDKSKKYTLVINFNNTIVNLKPTDFDNDLEGYDIELRPFLYDFLTEIGKYYEIIIYSNEKEKFIKPFITEIDNENKYFSHCLFGECVQYVNGEYVKDISLIGREIKTCVIVDCYQSSFKNQSENGILVKRYVGDSNSDKTLYYLEELLCRIALDKEIDDVRTGLNMYYDEILLKISCGQ